MNEPPNRNFIEMLNARWHNANSLAAVGIDPDISKIPKDIWDKPEIKEDIGAGIDYFCREVVKSTCEFVCAYKVQPAFFTSLGEVGERSLKNLFTYLLLHHPEIPIIMDGKFSDIENTVKQYVDKCYKYLRADAVLVNPLMGTESVLPFTERADKGVFVLCKTSNASASELLDLPTNLGIPIWRYILNLALEKWNANENVGLVMSANSPNDLIGIRQNIGDTPVLLAGVGAQSGDLRTTIPHVIDSDGFGVIVPSSRKIIFAPAKENESFVVPIERAVRELRDSINTMREV